jgi:anti-anti-sigma factor
MLRVYYIIPQAALFRLNASLKASKPAVAGVTGTLKERVTQEIMELGGSEKGIYSVIGIIGKIDRLKDSIVLKSYVNTLIEKGRVTIALNLSKVTYLDSGALNVFIYSYEALNKKGGHLALIEPSEYVKDVLEVVGLTKLVKIFPTEEDFNHAIKNA